MEQYDVTIFLIALLIASKWVIGQYTTRSHKMQMQPVVVIANSFDCGRYDSLWICWNSHTAIAMGLKLSSIPFSDRILSLKDASTLSQHCHSPFLLVFQRFRNDPKPFDQNHLLLTDGILRLRAGVEVGKISPTPATAPTPAKTADSDRLQLQSRLRLCSPGQQPVLFNFSSRVMLEADRPWGVLDRGLACGMSNM